MSDTPKIPASFQTIEVPQKQKLLSEEGLKMAATIVEMLSALAVQAGLNPRILALGAYNFYLVSKRMVIDQDAEVQATFYEDSERLLEHMLKDAPPDVKEKWEIRGKTEIRPS